MSNPSATSAIASHLRDHDRDRYIAALFAPKRVRDPLMVLYAFNAEIARIPDLVSEPALGEIRLQWWRDVLEADDARAVIGNPVADALGETIETHGLSTASLLGMIDARSADLDGGGFADMQAFKAYQYKTHGAVFALSAKILGQSGSSLGRAANEAGVAYGTMHTLVSLPRDAAHGRVMLPLSLLQEHDVLPESVLAGEGGEGIRPAVSELVQEVRTALQSVRGRTGELDSTVHAAFAPLALVEPALRAIEKPDVQPLRDVVVLNPLARFFRLWRASRTGRL